jgi:tetratricopeptide (TPR) repeat protein
MPNPMLRAIWLAIALVFLAGVQPASEEPLTGVPGVAGAAQTRSTQTDSAQSASVQVGGAPQAPDVEGLRQQAFDEGQAGKADDAIRDYKRALQISPDWKEGWWNLGMLQYGSDRFENATQTFQKVVGFAPGLGNAWGLLGLCEFETGNYADALSHLEQAKTIGMDDVDIARVAAYHLGLLLIRAGEFDQASALLLPAFGTGNASEQAKIALGLALLRIPLLPKELDPSREGLVLAAGEAATAGADQPARLAALIEANPSVPFLHLAYGVALGAGGKEKSAQEEILAETQISPASPDPWISLSRLAMNRHEADEGALSEAIKYARRAVEVAPDDRDAHLALAQAWDAAGDAAQAAAESKLAKEAATKPAVAEQRMVRMYGVADATTGTKTAEANEQLWKRALGEYRAGDYAAAITDLKASLAASQDNGTGWAMLGLCEFAQKDFGNALIHLDRGAKLGLSASSDSLYRARYTFGILLVHAGEFDRAADILSTAIKAPVPLGDKVEFALGLVLLRKEEFPEEARLSQAALIAAAGSIESLLLESKYDEAFPKLKELLKQYPTTPFLHYAYGTALIALSQFGQASEQMKAEMVISPASELPCASLASIALRQHDAASAIRWSQRAIQLDPNSVDAHYLLGRGSLEAGDLPTAMHELEVAATLSPASPEIHFNLAKAYARANMPAKAQGEREIFSRLNEVNEKRPGLKNGSGLSGSEVQRNSAPARASDSPQPR